MMFSYPIRKLREEGDGKFSEMVELLGPQSRKTLELIEFKFAPKRRFSQNFRGAIGAAADFERQNDIILRK